MSLRDFLNTLAKSNSTIFIDTEFCGNVIEAKFLKMWNIQGDMYAEVEILKPKKVLYHKKVVNLTLLDTFSKTKGLYVGQEQRNENKDSLNVPRGEEKTWENGHIGCFKLFDLLAFSDQEQEIRDLLSVDENWDAEWEEDDIVD